MVRDVLGQAFNFSDAPRRVVSLVPSLTETLVDLGVGDALVGVTDFCIFPAELDRTRVGGTKNPRIDVIRELDPDLVHVNLEENLKRHADALALFTRVFVSEPKSVDDVQTLITTLGEIHDRSDRARTLTDELRDAIASISKRTFSFACAIWKKPWMWCGGDTYVSSLVATAGGRNVLQGSSRYPAKSLAEIASLNPDVIFLPDEPYVFQPADAAEVASETKAQVIGPFPGHLFTWHGTRTIKGLHFLRDVDLGP